MSLGLTPMENIARARSDLRLGLPVIVKADRMALCLPVETLTSERLEAIRSLADEHLLVLTDRRAHTLKLAAYDQDLVRIDLPMSFDKRWVQSVADPSTDLSYPMKGPFRCKRGGEVSIERTILALLKSAQLLPAAIVTYIEDPAPLQDPGPDNADHHRREHYRVKEHGAPEAPQGNVAAQNKRGDGRYHQHQRHLDHHEYEGVDKPANKAVSRYGAAFRSPPVRAIKEFAVVAGACPVPVAGQNGGVGVRKADPAVHQQRPEGKKPKDQHIECQKGVR